MAIFCVIAWTIQAADYLGLIETESKDPKSVAYRRTHEALAFLRSQLEGATCLEVSPNQLTFQSKGQLRKLCGQTDFALGPHGRVEFSLSPHQYLQTRFLAFQDQEQHQLEVSLRVSLAPVEGRSGAEVPSGECPGRLTEAGPG